MRSRAHAHTRMCVSACRTRTSMLARMHACTQSRLDSTRPTHLRHQAATARQHCQSPRQGSSSKARPLLRRPRRPPEQQLRRANCAPARAPPPPPPPPPALPPSRPPALPPGASGADIACVRWACSRADLPHSPPCAPPEPPSCHSIAPLSSVASRANLEWHRPRSSRRRVAGAWRLGGCVPSSLGGCRCLPLSRWLGQCRCRDTRWAGSVSPCLAVTGPAVYSASCPSRLTQLAHLQLRAREFAASALPARARRVGWAGGGA